MIVHATNGLGDSTLGTALHTHGMFFNGTNHFDGAVSTTQCPIPPGQTLDYEIDTSLQTGTYWFVNFGSRSPWPIVVRVDPLGFMDTTLDSIRMVSVHVSPSQIDFRMFTESIAFIILPQNGTGRSDNTTWDDEFTLIVSDWYHKEYKTMIDNEFLIWKNPTGAEPVPGTFHGPGLEVICADSRRIGNDLPRAQRLIHPPRL